MILYIKDTDFQTKYVIDVFSSLIWTKRYYQYGDFELQLPIKSGYSDIFQLDYYVQRDDDDTIMIIEKIETTTDAENGNYILISGRSLESILARRVIWSQTKVTGKASERINKLITSQCVTSGEYRKIDNLVVSDTTPGSDTSTSSQYTGNNLYEVVEELAQGNGLGFRISLQNSTMTFEIYEGTDYSYGNKDNNPYVVFSPEFNNLLSSDYIADKENFANVARVFGSGEGSARQKYTYGATTSKGLNRYEVYVDARDVSSDETTDEETLCKAKGAEALTENTLAISFDSSVLPYGQYTYKTDYNIGDIVQVKDVYGYGMAVRIVEIIESWSTSGYSITPAFAEPYEVTDN